ncbi:MAG: acyltransferase [Bryobacteraceae bacterium]
MTTASSADPLREKSGAASRRRISTVLSLTSAPRLGALFAERHNNFDIIRLIAAMLVIYGHSYALARPGSGMDLFTRLIGWGFSGGLAVDTFFVISGFLVTASIMNGGLAYYFAARILRIYPALVVCIALLVFMLGPLLTTSPHYWSSPDPWRYFAKVASAYGMEWFLPGVFEQHRDKAVNGSIWSLVVEVRMYILLVILHVLGLLRRAALMSGLIAATLIAGYWLHPRIPLAWSPTDYHVSSLFLLGMLCWLNRDRIPMSPLLLVPLLALAAALHGTPHFIAGYSLVVCYSVFLIGFAPGADWRRWLGGDYSYGVFLYGWPVQQCVLLWNRDMPAWQNAAMSIPLALALGALSWHGVEKRALSWKKRFR